MSGLKEKTKLKENDDIEVAIEGIVCDKLWASPFDVLIFGLIEQGFSKDEIVHFLNKAHKQGNISYARSNSPCYWNWDDKDWEQEKSFFHRHGISDKKRQLLREIATQLLHTPKQYMVLTEKYRNKLVRRRLKKEAQP
jgi:hypothetical protein